MKNKSQNKLLFIFGSVVFGAMLWAAIIGNAVSLGQKQSESNNQSSSVLAATIELSIAPSSTPTLMPSATPAPMLTPTNTIIPFTFTPTTALTSKQIATAKPRPTSTPRPVATQPQSQNQYQCVSGAMAICKDGTISFSQNRRGTCSYHGGVLSWC
jgi:cytoskeletal protein RodZ